MTKIIKTSNVAYGVNASLFNDSVIFSRGFTLDFLPAMYDKEGCFVDIVNLWFLDLKTVKHLSDINSSVRALMRYWSFLEDESLKWDHFPPIKRIKPTYLFRNTNLLYAVESGELASSTANIYMNHVVQFYIWAIENHHLIINDERTAPFNIEIVKRQSNDLLAHLKPRIVVQTSDLRIRVPRHSTPVKRSLQPLTKEHLILLSEHLRAQPVELVLMVLLATESGLRLNEVCTFTLNALVQARATNEMKTRYQLTIGPLNGIQTKFKKKRNIEMSATLFEMLQRYAISERRLTRLKKSQILSQKHEKFIQQDLGQPAFFEPLFISQQGNCVKPQVLNARWIELRNNINQNVPGFRYRFHDLRSTYATYRLDNLLKSGLSEGEALDCIMGWMGHKNESTTFRYIAFLRKNEMLRFTFSLLDTLMDASIRGEKDEIL
ncbi:site-specific integrase [Enterobacter kobei]|nr:site-specific integrase [Enterobacter kobei]